MPASLSVIMPAYNVERFIADAVASLERQGNVDLNVIIVDDGSTDSTAEIAERLAREKSTDGFRISVLHQARQGPAAARNAALNIADGRYIGFLDADDRWLPCKAEIQVKVLEDQPDIDLTFSWFRYISEDGDDLHAPYTPHVSRPDLPSLYRKNNIHTGTVIARRAAIDRAGGFDPAIRTFEDFDLWLRVAHLRPLNVMCVPEILTDYRRREGQLTKDWRQMHVGWEAVMQKHLGLHPDILSPIIRDARGNHLEYCSSLAFATGDHKVARELMVKAWRCSGARFLTRPPALLMSAICVASLLPRRLQVLLGNAYASVRQLRHWKLLRSANDGIRRA